MEERDRRVTDKMEREAGFGEREKREHLQSTPWGRRGHPYLWPGLFFWGIAKVVQSCASCWHSCCFYCPACWRSSSAPAPARDPSPPGPRLKKVTISVPKP